MKVNILASGSSGNCIALTVDNQTILIDAGIAKTKIEKALLKVDIRPDDVQAIFITHAHGDHVKGLPLANKYKIPVYASEGEWKDIKGVEDDLINEIDLGVILEPFHIATFDAHHDSYEPVGYAIETADMKVSICLDTGHVDNEMLDEMKDSDVYIIESNHEPVMVGASEYPKSVKTRILSDVGHLSNEQTAKALCKLVKGNGEQIYLTHLSSNNNLPSLAKTITEMALLKKGLYNGKHYKLEVM